METKQYERIGRPTIIVLFFVVVAFMMLSLGVTATGTARFAVAMGYDPRLGYVVGAIFDVAKGALPMALLALLTRRAFGRAVLLSLAWLCLLLYSCLATHATVGMAMTSIERAGSWKMEVRSNDKAELASVEQQLAALEKTRQTNVPAPARQRCDALARLQGIGEVGASRLALELFWREFDNRREVGACIGLVPQPYDRQLAAIA